MTINDQSRDEKLQYDINRKAAQISAKSSRKLHKYEYLTGEGFVSAFVITDKIRDGKIDLSDVKNNQENLSLILEK